MTKETRKAVKRFMRNVAPTRRKVKADLKRVAFEMTSVHKAEPPTNTYDDGTL